MTVFRGRQEKIEDRTYIVISAGKLPCRFSHLLCGHKVPSHLVNDSKALPRCRRVESGAVRVTNLNCDFEVFLRVVQPVHGNVKLSEGVVAQCGSDCIFSDVLEFDIKSPEVLLLCGLVMATLLESKAFVVILDSFSHRHRVGGGRIDMGAKVHGSILRMHSLSFLWGAVPVVRSLWFIEESVDPSRSP